MLPARNKVRKILFYACARGGPLFLWRLESFWAYCAADELRSDIYVRRARVHIVIRPSVCCVRRVVPRGSDEVKGVVIASVNTRYLYTFFQFRTNVYAVNVAARLFHFILFIMAAIVARSENFFHFQISC